MYIVHPQAAVEPRAGSPDLSNHARRRRAQRGFRAGQIEYVLRFGTVYRRAGATFYVLRRRDVPTAHRRDDACAKLAGTVVVVEDGVVTTAYRNDDPVHHVQKKAKYDKRRRKRVPVYWFATEGGSEALG